QSLSSGAMGDLAPHMIQAALTLVGPITSLNGMVDTVHKKRIGPTGTEDVVNDDHAQFMCRFENGAMGSLFFSRVATGRKMGYIYEVTGTKGAIRFDQEDQNALWLYKAEGPPESRGFRKILAGPDHPDYLPFCQGPGHGTGYQDQIIIEAAHFLEAIADGKPTWPDFRVGLEVNRIVEAVRTSSENRSWVEV
ncbi:MAG: Gfo/Idh/MocA family protein, partial [Rhizobiaceae bacterium]